MRYFRGRSDTGVLDRERRDGEVGLVAGPATSKLVSASEEAHTHDRLPASADRMHRTGGDALEVAVARELRGRVRSDDSVRSDPLGRADYAIDLVDGCLLAGEFT